MTNKKALTKKELIERLKTIAADETPREYSMGAMCYSMGYPSPEPVKCDICGKEIKPEYDHDDIKGYVEKFKQRGYDAKIQCLCFECADKTLAEIKPKLKPKKRKEWLIEDTANYLFSFRISKEDDYYRVFENYSCMYRVLLAFLDGETSYLNDFDCRHYLADELEDLLQMTGIKEIKKIKPIHEVIVQNIHMIQKQLSEGSIAKAEADERILELTAKLEKMCPHFR